VTAPSANFYQALTGDLTTHRFTWEPGRIEWNSYNGHVAGVDDRHGHFPCSWHRRGSPAKPDPFPPLEQVPIRSGDDLVPHGAPDHRQNRER
jgi:hypothetical protein